MRLPVFVFILSTMIPWTRAQDVVVSSRNELIKAASHSTPGTTIRIAPGTYPGGIHVLNLRGTRAKPITITALKPDDWPLFEGGQSGLHFSKCEYVLLTRLKIRGASGNGINIDDGGDIQSPAHHIILDQLEVLETGPKGNHDGIKLSGLDHFEVKNCRVVGWGGSAIDMVGCHEGNRWGTCHLCDQHGFGQRAEQAGKTWERFIS